MTHDDGARLLAADHETGIPETILGSLVDSELWTSVLITNITNESDYG
jgi:hypothetical protein